MSESSTIPDEGQPDDENQNDGGQAAAAAEIDTLIAQLGPEKAREALELILTELVTGEDPESQG